MSFGNSPRAACRFRASQMTDSRTITLRPFAVEAIEYQFYFPAEGTFQALSVHRGS